MNGWELHFHRYTQLAMVLFIVLPVAAFLLTVLITRPLIDWLTAKQFGKAIRVDGPDHAAKAGTPTMGGIGMLVVIGILGLGLMAMISYSYNMGPLADRHLAALLPVIIPLVAIMAFSVLGLTDDLAGLARRSGRGELGVGLTARKMLAAQFVVAVAVAGLLVWAATLERRILDVSSAFYPWALGAIAVLVIVGTVNGVNFSDGLDGLAAGLLALAFGTIGIVRSSLFTLAVVSSSIDELGEWNTATRLESQLSIFALPLVAAAACLGFLVFNRHPARVFMGNVASMGLGGGLAAMSLVSGMWVFLPIFGIVFLAEVVSDILQIGYFKWTGGKRLFRMAPLHHHFELGGMSETQVVRRFWAVGLVGSLLVVVPIWIITTFTKP